MKYMNHKKSRVTDLFRKMDKNNEGFIPREDFIDGIMRTSKFISTFILHFNIYMLCMAQNSRPAEWK